MPLLGILNSRAPGLVCPIFCLQHSPIQSQPGCLLPWLRVQSWMQSKEKKHSNSGLVSLEISSPFCHMGSQHGEPFWFPSCVYFPTLLSANCLPPAPSANILPPTPPTPASVSFWPCLSTPYKKTVKGELRSAMSSIEPVPHPYVLAKVRPSHSPGP